MIEASKVESYFEAISTVKLMNGHAINFDRFNGIVRNIC